jgi:hypothetical protein
MPPSGRVHSRGRPSYRFPKSPEAPRPKAATARPATNWLALKVTAKRPKTIPPRTPVPTPARRPR